jgi:predicted RNA-binding protein with PIN domain
MAIWVIRKNPLTTLLKLTLKITLLKLNHFFLILICKDHVQLTAMSLHLIIDGYNLIRQSPWLSLLDARDLEEGREALLQALSDYHRRRPQHKLTVVFDGWQGGALQESRDLCAGVVVIYSRRGERADEVIKRFLTREGQKMVMVSSDRELQDFAEKVGATWVPAAQFETLYLQNTPNGGEEDHEEAPVLLRGTTKKGPARRLKKSLRQKKGRLRKL